MHAELLQSCLTPRDPVDWSPPGSSVHGDSPGKNIRMGCHVLLQGIFPTQVSLIAGGFFTVWATIFPILLFSSISLYCSLRKVLFLLAILWNYSGVYIFPFSFAFNFSSFLSYLWILFRQQFCLFAFLFLGNGFDHCLLHSVANLPPQSFRHFVYQI